MRRAILAFRPLCAALYICGQRAHIGTTDAPDKDSRHRYGHLIFVRLCMCWLLFHRIRIHRLYIPVHLPRVQILYHKELHFAFPAVGSLQRRKHSVRNLEGGGRCQEVLGLHFASACKPLQIAQGMTGIQLWKLILNKIKQCQSHLYDHAPSSHEKSIPDATHHRLAQVACKQGKKPLQGVVLGIDTVSVQSCVHLWQKALNEAVKNPDCHSKLWKAWPVKIHEGEAQEQGQGTVKCGSLIVREHADDCGRNKVQALAISNVPEPDCNCSQKPEEGRLPFAIFRPKQLLLW
mmetsp:Transcript_2470/g.6162  ORF Transcript_2470/g.6162 Transcript_2470/m.6162 type:complete len:291 (-) Transcript_2470:505-1377(-)